MTANSIQPLEVVRREKQPVPLEAKPGDVFLDCVNVFDLFLGRVRIVEAEVARPASFEGDPEIEADRLGVADMQVAVRLGRKTGDDPCVLAARQIVVDDRADEVDRRAARQLVGFGHGLCHFIGNRSRSSETATEVR